MAKASRVAARTAKTMLIMEQRMARLELMLEVMMTAKQRANFEALLPDEQVMEPVTANGSQPEPETEADDGSRQEA